MIPAYYNEHDEYPAQWLRNLIAAGHIPAGDVDTRSIADVQPDDLTAYGQCHFFAGIGGWAWAARVAGWPDERELWTGSAPCQPFSVAGEGRAQADDRHLWPDLFRLASARRPAVLMGEQVAAAIGKDWLDGIVADLAGIGYACGAVVVPACSVDAPHRRDRLWFVADTKRGRREAVAECKPMEGTQEREGRAGHQSPGRTSASSGDDAVANTDSAAIRYQPGRISGQGGAGAGLDRDNREGTLAYTDDWDPRCARDAGAAEGQRREHGPDADHRGAWDDSTWIVGHDGKARRVKSGVRLLAHGVPARVGKLRAYGNAIVPQVAAQVIGAYMDCMP